MVMGKGLRPTEYADMLTKNLRSPLFRSRLKTLRSLKNFSESTYGKKYEEAIEVLRRMKRARDHLRTGLSLTESAQKAGVSPSALGNWVYGRNQGLMNAPRPARGVFNNTNPEWGTLLGAVLAHGRLGSRGECMVRLRNKYFVDEALKAYNVVSGGNVQLRRVHLKRYGPTGEPFYSFGIGREFTNRIISAIIGKSGERRLNLDSLTRQQEDRALQALFDGNSSVISKTRHKKEGDIVEMHISMPKDAERYKTLLKQVQMMLAKRGVLSNINAGPHGSQVLNIKGVRNLRVFTDRIGFRVPAKNEKLLKWLENPPERVREYAPADYYEFREFIKNHPEMPIMQAAKERRIDYKTARYWSIERRRPRSVRTYERILGMTKEEAERGWYDRNQVVRERVTKSISSMRIPGISAPLAKYNEITARIKTHEGMKTQLERTMDTVPPKRFKSLKVRLDESEEELEVLKNLQREAIEEIRTEEAKKARETAERARLLRENRLSKQVEK